MTSMEESLNAMAYLHDYEIGGRLIFQNDKLIKINNNYQKNSNFFHTFKDLNKYS